jgi:hypothetical protein
MHCCSLQEPKETSSGRLARSSKLAAEPTLLCIIGSERSLLAEPAGDVDIIVVVVDVSIIGPE